MMTLQKDKAKYLVWFFAFLNIICILVLTLQKPVETTQLSKGVRNTMVQITETPMEVARQSWWYRNIRKLGHVAEYFPLGITSAWAWYLTSRRKFYLKALLLCALVSFSDQLLKGILPTRKFDVIDLFYDFGGYLLGIVIIACVLWGIQKCYNKPFDSNKERNRDGIGRNGG